MPRYWYEVRPVVKRWPWSKGYVWTVGDLSNVSIGAAPHGMTYTEEDAIYQATKAVEKLRALDKVKGELPPPIRREFDE